MNTTETIMRLEAALPQLTERDQDIIRMRWGWGNYPRPATLTEVAEKHHMTRERVRQIESSAIQKGRRILAALERGE